MYTGLRTTIQGSVVLKKGALQKGSADVSSQEVLQQRGKQPTVRV